MIARSVTGHKNNLRPLWKVIWIYVMKALKKTYYWRRQTYFPCYDFLDRSSPWGFHVSDAPAPSSLPSLPSPQYFAFVTQLSTQETASEGDFFRSKRNDRTSTGLNICSGILLAKSRASPSIVLSSYSSLRCFWFGDCLKTVWKSWVEMF